MGQAKSRGSFEERKQLAIEKQKLKEIERKEQIRLEKLKEIEYYNSLTDKEKIEYNNRKQNVKDYISISMSNLAGLIL